MCGVCGVCGACSNMFWQDEGSMSTVTTALWTPALHLASPSPRRAIIHPSIHLFSHLNYWPGKEKPRRHYEYLPEYFLTCSSPSNSSAVFLTRLVKAVKTSVSAASSPDTCEPKMCAFEVSPFRRKHRIIQFAVKNPGQDDVERQKL